MYYKLLGEKTKQEEEMSNCIFEKYCSTAQMIRGIDDWDLYGNKAAGITNDSLDKDHIKDWKMAILTLGEMSK